MDGNIWRATQPLAQAQGNGATATATATAAAAPASGAMETGDWRTQLEPESRQRIVNYVMEILKRYFPFRGPEGLRELKKIAVRFEEKIYTTATNQSDYLRKVSLKMLSMETKSQNPMANSTQATVAYSSQNPQGTGNITELQDIHGDASSVEMFQDVAESQKDKEENKDASSTAGLLEKLSFEDITG